MYLSFPPVFYTINSKKDEAYCIKIKNLYGACQASANWFVMLRDGLVDRGFIQIKIDPCLCYKKDSIIFAHVDDCIIFSKDHSKVKEIIKSLECSFKLTD